MSALNNARTVSALNLKAQATAPAAAKLNPLPSAQGDSSHATFSRFLERSRADAAAERHASATASRHDASPATGARAARHAAEGTESRAQARADAAEARESDPHTRATAEPRGRHADASRARPDAAAGDEGHADSTDASSAASPQVEDDASAMQTEFGPTDLMPPPSGSLPPSAPTASPTGAGASATELAAEAAGGAANPLALLGKATAHMGGWAQAGAAGAAGVGAMAQTSEGSDGRGVALPAAAAADPTLTLDAPALPAVLPDAALAQLAALSAGAGKTDGASKLPSALDALPAGVGAALAHPGLGHLARASDSPALPTASVSTAVTDPGFQEALATQVSVFARGGLSKAELHLNPAELGPVSVQITMNGDQARVDFGADRAQTRQAIEAGWAALAASLQDAGFTLSGGGVSEQAGRQAAHQQTMQAEGRTPRPAAVAETDAPATTIVAARPRTGAALDLYA